jgi:hypothetical protein
LYVIGGVGHSIPGPKAKSLKYDASLCRRCNDTTQPFDRAYDAFVDWILANEELVLRRRFTDFADVFGHHFAESQRDLYKYFAKSFGCKLVSAGCRVPRDVVELLWKDSFKTMLRLSLAVNEDVLILPSMDRDGFIGKGGLIGWAARDTPTEYTSFTWNEHVSWLTVCYWYDVFPDGTHGSTWVADGQYIYLGALTPLADEMRAELSRKVAARAG